MRTHHGWLMFLIAAAPLSGCQRGETHDPLEAYRREQARKQEAVTRAETPAAINDHEGAAIAGGLDKPVAVDPALVAADPFLRSQIDIEMSGRWAGPGVLQVTVMNKLATPLAVGPENFGLIIPPEKKVHAVLPDTRKTFPATKMAPGAQVSGQLLFEAPPAGTTETRLVFRHPQAKPAMARIE